MFLRNFSWVVVMVRVRVWNVALYAAENWTLN